MFNPSGSAGLDHGRTTLDGIIADLPPDPVAEGPFLGVLAPAPIITGGDPARRVSTRPASISTATKLCSRPNPNGHPCSMPAGSPLRDLSMPCSKT